MLPLCSFRSLKCQGAGPEFGFLKRARCNSARRLVDSPSWVGRHRPASTVDVGRVDAIPIQLMKATIAVDPDHPSGSWWRAARDAKHPPPELRPLLTGKATTIEVAPKRARELRAWCAAFEGWDPESAPLSFVGLVGRPPSPRRSEGARSLHVRLAPHDPG